MVKTTYSDPQTAFAYAVYMMVGSYYEDTEHISAILEKSMRLQYVEQKSDNQYRMEETVIRYVEGKLMKELPADFFDDVVTVKVVRQKDGTYSTYFVGGSYVLRVNSNNMGKRYDLSYAYKAL